MARRPPGPHGHTETPVDALYQGPLDGFIGTRKLLAAALKREGRSDERAAVLSLAKPSPSAWAVNQVYWHARDTWNRLLTASDALRALQERMLAGQAADPREAMAARQRAAQAVVDRAVEALRDAGNAATDSTRQRLAVTVDAIAAYGSRTKVYTPGQLVTDLDPPGFAALASLGEPNLRLVKGGQMPGSIAPAPPTSTPIDTDRGPTDESAQEAELRRGASEDGTNDPAAAKRLQHEREAAAEQRRADLERALATAEREAREAHDKGARLDRLAATARAAADAHGRDVEGQRRTLAALEARLAELLEKAKEAEGASEGARRDVQAAEARVATARADLERE